MGNGGALPGLDAAILKPYASVVVLICPNGVNAPSAVDQIVQRLRRLRRPPSDRRGALVVAEGFGDSAEGEAGDAEGEAGDSDGPVLVRTLVYEVRATPSWLAEPLFQDVEYQLSVVFRWSDLIAVHLAPIIRDAFQTWLDKAPLPMVRRVPGDVLEQALLGGETKGLWLRGVHTRRKTKADSKNIVGGDLREALNVGEDQTYVLNSGRSLLPSSPSRAVLKGLVGTTPGKSSVWSGLSDSFHGFRRFAHELLVLIRSTMNSSLPFASTFSMLAQPAFDYQNISEAYDIGTSIAVDLPPGTSPDKMLAAEVLDDATLIVRGQRKSSAFDLEIGRFGSVGATLRGEIRTGPFGAKLKLHLAGGMTDPELAEPVRQALKHTDLLTVYYASGHTYTQDALYRAKISPKPFPQWKWCNFDGYDLVSEKPQTTSPDASSIHAAIGGPGDVSLFNWIVRNLPSGWLTCDDGPDEIADFVHVDANDFGVTLVHVKGAHSSSSRRGVSASAYEVVIGQAVKNAIFLEDDILIDRLGRPPTKSPATWSDGIRVANRNELLEAIGERDSRSRSSVLIVQPHVRRELYENLRSGVDQRASESLRLHRLETMLNAARSSIVARGAELTVIAAGAGTAGN